VEPNEAEAQIRAAHDRREMGVAATLTLERYGPELLGYLAAVARGWDDAAEAFSIFCEDLWVGLPSFQWRCSMRTWVYGLSRNALARQYRDPQRRGGAVVPLSDAPQLRLLADRLRSTTQQFLKTESKDRFARIRAQLEPEDQALLILRIDRRMSWREIAEIQSGQAGALDDDDARRASASARKRFERVKARLRERFAKP